MYSTQVENMKIFNFKCKITIELYPLQVCTLLSTYQIVVQADADISNGWEKIKLFIVI